MTRNQPVLLFAAVSAVLWSSPALAQLQGTVIETGSRGNNTSVRERARPEYDSPGIALGGFIVSPSVDVEAGYTSNALLEEENGSSDGYVGIRPVVAVNSGWSRHAIAGEVHGDFRRYFNRSIRDADSFGLSMRGKYELGVSTVFTGAVRADRRFESQYNVASIVAGGAVIPLDDLSATFAATETFGRFRLNAFANASRLNYRDFTSISGDRVGQDARDRDGLATGIQLDYSISPDTYAFVQLGAEQFRYDEPLGLGIANRDSNAGRIIVGFSTDLTRLLRGRIGVGYIDRSYQAPFKDVSGFTIEGQLEYFPTELTTVTLGAHRVIEDAAVADIGGFFRTGGEVRVDHELLRNLLLNARVSYDDARYQPGSRVELWDLGAGATYLVNRNVTLGLDLGYGTRDRTGIAPGNGFDEFRAGLSFGYRL